MKSSAISTLLLALMLLLHQPVAALNWQAAGAINNVQTTTVWGYIEMGLKSYADG